MGTNNINNRYSERNYNLKRLSAINNFLKLVVKIKTSNNDEEVFQILNGIDNYMELTNDVVNGFIDLDETLSDVKNSFTKMIRYFDENEEIVSKQVLKSIEEGKLLAKHCESLSEYNLDLVSYLDMIDPTEYKCTKPFVGYLKNLRESKNEKTKKLLQTKIG